MNDFSWTTSLKLLHLNYLTLYISLAFIYFNYLIQRTCSRLSFDLFISCSWPCGWIIKVLVIIWSDLFLTCSHLIHDLFMTCSWLFHILFKVCWWLVHNLFKSYSWLVYDLIITYSLVSLKMQKLQFLVHLVAIIINEFFINVVLPGKMSNKYSYSLKN